MSRPLPVALVPSEKTRISKKKGRGLEQTVRMAELPHKKRLQRGNVSLEEKQKPESAPDREL